MKTYSDNNGNIFTAEELLPCPFCGSQAEIQFIGNNATKSRKVTIKCSNYNCRVERTDATLGHNHEWCARNCIESWNKRTPMQSYADQCVKAREEEINRYLNLNTMDNTASEFIRGFNTACDQAVQFLSTPSSQVEPTKESKQSSLLDEVKMLRDENELLKATLKSMPHPIKGKKCDFCGCHPSVIITNQFGTFCQQHARYI